MDATPTEIKILAGQPAKLDIKETDYGKRMTLSVKSIKDGGWIVKIKNASDLDGPAHRIHPGQTICLITSGELVAESAKDTTLTISIPA